MTDQPVNPPQFFLTSPAPCPYLSDRQERKVFTHLVGDRASELNDILTQGGFRRSQNIAYRPACDRCSACTSVRVRASEFKPTRSMKRVWKANHDLIGHEYEAEPTSEQYSLFRSYIDARHQSGGMSDMSVLDYTMMVEDSHVDSRIIEYRRRGIDTALTKKGEGGLIAVALMDVMADGLSMVYSFFDPASRGRSLGTFMILDHIERACKRGLPHVYLGYWVNGSRKMAYKIRFQPQDHLLSQGWTPYENPNRSTAENAAAPPDKKI